MPLALKGAALSELGRTREAVLALELASAFLEKFGGDSLAQVRESFDAWRAAVREL